MVIDNPQKALGEIIQRFYKGKIDLPVFPGIVHDIHTTFGLIYMDARAHVIKGKVASVAIHMVPSFVLDTNREIVVEGLCSE